MKFGFTQLVLLVDNYFASQISSDARCEAESCETEYFYRFVIATKTSQTTPTVLPQLFYLSPLYFSCGTH